MISSVILIIFVYSRRTNTTLLFRASIVELLAPSTGHNGVLHQHECKLPPDGSRATSEESCSSCSIKVWLVKVLTSTWARRLWDGNPGEATHQSHREVLQPGFKYTTWQSTTSCATNKQRAGERGAVRAPAHGVGRQLISIKMETISPFSSGKRGW